MRDLGLTGQGSLRQMLHTLPGSHFSDAFAPHRQSASSTSCGAPASS
jgi:hypothetical protein